MYSPSFQAPGDGGAAAFLSSAASRSRPASRPSPSSRTWPRRTVGADRRLVTFIQRFGDGAVRKELTMVREGDAWRIVAERTLEVL